MWIYKYTNKNIVIFIFQGCDKVHGLFWRGSTRIYLRRNLHRVQKSLLLVRMRTVIKVFSRKAAVTITWNMSAISRRGLDAVTASINLTSWGTWGNTRPLITEDLISKSLNFMIILLTSRTIDARMLIAKRNSRIHRLWMCILTSSVAKLIVLRLILMGIFHLIPQSNFVWFWLHNLDKN